MEKSVKCLRDYYYHFYDYYLKKSGFYIFNWCWRKLVNAKANIYIKHILASRKSPNYGMPGLFPICLESGDNND